MLAVCDKPLGAKVAAMEEFVRPDQSQAKVEICCDMA
jgi:hypothetical protein